MRSRARRRRSPAKRAIRKPRSPPTPRPRPSPTRIRTQPAPPLAGDTKSDHRSGARIDRRAPIAIYLLIRLSLYARYLALFICLSYTPFLRFDAFPPALSPFIRLSRIRSRSSVPSVFLGLLLCFPTLELIGASRMRTSTRDYCTRDGWIDRSGTAATEHAGCEGDRTAEGKCRRLRLRPLHPGNPSK